LEYIREKITSQCNNRGQIESLLDRSQLNQEKVALIFENLIGPKLKKNLKIEDDTKELIQDVYKEVIALFPNLL
jgi:hypothetical protein